MTGVMSSRKWTNRRTIAALGLGLVVVGVLAVISRFVLLDQPVDEAEATEMAVQAEINARLMQEKISDQLLDQPVNEEHARLDSPMGQALFRQCLEWSEFHENHPSEATLENREKACNEYRDYISMGAKPE
jgi:hypothetical protein